MLFELAVIGQLITFGPDGVERFCVTRYVIDEPTIEFADHEGTWRRSSGEWVMLHQAGPCQTVVADEAQAPGLPAEPGTGEGAGADTF